MREAKSEGAKKALSSVFGPGSYMNNKQKKKILGKSNSSDIAIA